MKPSTSKRPAMSKKKARSQVTKVRHNGLLGTLTIGLLVFSGFNITVLTLSHDEFASIQQMWNETISDIWQVLIPGPLRGCVIKGNINIRGDHIYHTPESPYYSKTVINNLRGERWFCSVQEAEAAGWRAPYKYRGF